MSRQTRGQRRRTIRSLILDRNFEGLFTLNASYPDTATYVVAFVFDRDDLTRWRAIEALGRLSAHLAQIGDLEKVRGIIRRILWLMNDESGGIAWNGPEAIGEILYDVPVLLEEYGRIVASFIDQEPFGPGTHWAIARMTERATSEFEDSLGELERSLESELAEERGHALMSLSKIDPELGAKASETLLEDSGELHLYDFETGNLEKTTVGDIAREIRDRGTRAA